MEGKGTAGNTGTVSRRLKEKLAVEDIYGVEESEEVDTEKIDELLNHRYRRKRYLFYRFFRYR